MTRKKYLESVRRAGSNLNIDWDFEEQIDKSDHEALAEFYQANCDACTKTVVLPPNLRAQKRAQGERAFDISKDNSRGYAVLSVIREPRLGGGA